MKLVNFQSAGGLRVGLLDGLDVVDPLAVHEAGSFLTPEAQRAMADSTALIAAWDIMRPLCEEALARSRASGAGRVRTTDAALAAPLRPSTILCSGSNYLSHNQEKPGSDVSGTEPEFFIKTSDCVVGPGQPIVHDRRLTMKLDGEAELAIIVGRPGRHIPVERALEHVFGYTVVNDVTARDRQVRRRADGTHWYELGRGKVFDTSAPLGPCITTRDEIPDPQNLVLRSWVNGELRQISSTSQMIWSVAELVHTFSINLTLRPGMVIITGTPSGTAWSTDTELGGKWSGHSGMVPARGYLQPGDVIVCEIENVGRLENPVVSAR